uniref:uncharacterized protein LOC108949962 n=1 Tax=Ciona intestinalis TaxID=7719 RepID=UPI00089DB81E|nr:uncharacterized protein LOC108949962 [Ciona intestinalis]|eukprot:XP_018669770.1 uncharacterized protein LOC108949962 [Ciona intestinalis]
MDSNIEEEEGKDDGVYVFKAPPVVPVDPNANSDDTNAIIGAVVACVIISVVLFFLWKMMERKQREMTSLQRTLEETLDVETPDIQPKSVKAKVATTSDPKDLPVLPNMSDTVEEEDDLHFSLMSPILSSTSIQNKEEAGSGDTGYHSGFCRIEGNSLRHRNVTKEGFDELELDIEHPSDIISALKKSRLKLKQATKDRRKRARNALLTLGECHQLMGSIQNQVHTEATKEIEAGRSLKKARAERKRHSIKHRYRRHWNKTSREIREKKDAFLFMQDWFDGLDIHTKLREIAEDLFLLRSQHSSDLERDEDEKEMVKDSVAMLQSCEHDVRRAKSLVVKMQEEIKFRLKSNNTGNIGGDDERNLHGDGNITGEERGKQSRLRIKLPKRTNKNSVAPEQGVGDRLDANDIGMEKCPKCSYYTCKCSTKSIASNDSPRFRGIPSKEPTGAKISDVSNRCHHLTLKLLPVEGEVTSSDESLTEREVKKALSRVDAISSVVSAVKRNGQWNIVVVSTQSRVSNIRFNWRRRTYVIGMLKEAEVAT